MTIEQIIERIATQVAARIVDEKLAAIKAMPVPALPMTDKALCDLWQVSSRTTRYWRNRKTNPLRYSKEERTVIYLPSHLIEFAKQREQMLIKRRR